MAYSYSEPPQLLLVPGLEQGGPDNWQSIWESARADTHRVDLGLRHNPNRNSWVNHLNLAIRGARQPVILVAHGLGALLVAWWAAMERPLRGGPVAGALLIAPPDLDSGLADARLATFAPAPTAILPFPSILVASRNDPQCRNDRARRLADFWGSRFVEAGSIGHVGAGAGVAEWPLGLFLLDQLIGIAANRGEPDSSPRFTAPTPTVPYVRDLTL